MTKSYPAAVSRQVYPWPKRLKWTPGLAGRIGDVDGEPVFMPSIGGNKAAHRWFDRNPHGYMPLSAIPDLHERIVVWQAVDKVAANFHPGRNQSPWKQIRASERYTILGKMSARRRAAKLLELCGDTAHRVFWRDDLARLRKLAELCNMEGAIDG
jgi:hypothetical protein